jgi:hypothetical protein
VNALQRTRKTSFFFTEALNSERAFLLPIPSSNFGPYFNIICNSYGHEAVMNDPCRVVYEPDKGLPSCPGAKVWIETYSKVKVICKEFNNIIKDTTVRCGFGLKKPVKK